jgi:hypothetical protein
MPIANADFRTKNSSSNQTILNLQTVSLDSFQEMKKNNNSATSFN